MTFSLLWSLNEIFLSLANCLLTFYAFNDYAYHFISCINIFLKDYWRHKYFLKVDPILHRMSNLHNGCDDTQ